MSKNKYKSPCKCDECVKKYTKKQRELLANVMVRTTILIGDFSHCSACKFLFETINDSKLYLCSRCNHLYEGKTGIDEDECKCGKEKYSIYFRHVIETCIPGICVYCKSENTVYLKSKNKNDHDNLFVVGEPGWGYYTMKCLDCHRKTRECYKLEFEVSEGN